MVRKIFLLLISHGAVGVAGFALGIYLLPILTAPAGPSSSEIAKMSSQAVFRGEFKKDLAGSDLLHWGEGTLSIGAKFITFEGELAPGPDYKLYLTPSFVETEADFLALKANSVRVGDVKTFDNFVVPIPDGLNLADFDTALVWCESFEQFISAARYR